MKRTKYCAIETCLSLNETPCGLCSYHFKQSERARAKKKYRKWCSVHNVYLSRAKDDDTGERLYKSSGDLVQDVCKCGKPYTRPYQGHRQMCPDCLHNRHTVRRKKQEAKAKKLKQFAEMLKSRGDKDPNLQTLYHVGPPKKITMRCEFPECNANYEVVLLEHKTKYPRFCEKHVGKI